MSAEQERLLRDLESQRLLTRPEVRDAMRRVPREAFLPDEVRSEAWTDAPLAIGEGQTISAPHMVAIMADALALRRGERVLEVGGGSGYHAAVFAELVGAEGRVVTVEILPRLAERACTNLKAAGYERVEVVTGDGTRGHPPNAPYDAISVAAAAPEVPPPLLAQLARGGRLVIPLGDLAGQDLLRIDAGFDGPPRTTVLGGCRFVPLRGEFGFKEA